MALSLKTSQAIAKMAKVLYNFLPWSGFKKWKGHISFQTIANEVGLGDFWQSGSKEPCIALLLERTLEHRSHLFERLIISIVKAGIKYRQKNNDPIREEEIIELNGLLLDVGYKFPFLWDKSFIESLRYDSSRTTTIVEQEIEAEKIRSSKQLIFEENREKLRNEFYELYKMEDRQLAGLKLEDLLNRLFELYELKPRNPFRVTGEQIDGSFELDNEIYLLEAKWESKKLSEESMLSFRGKIEGKSSFTRGLFISINGFTEQGLEAIKIGKQPTFFLMDGYDITVVLEGKVRFGELLRLKVRRLAEEGKMLHRVI